MTDQIPEDLKRRTSGHGFSYGCECDLQGGDPVCQIQPPYETIEAYVIRLIEYIIKIGRERDALNKGYLEVMAERMMLREQLAEALAKNDQLLTEINQLYTQADRNYE